MAKAETMFTPWHAYSNFCKEFILTETTKSNSLDLIALIEVYNKLSFKSNNLHQITSANSINSRKLYKNKYENIMYKNYNNSQINLDVNTIYTVVRLKFDIVPSCKI